MKQPPRLAVYLLHRLALPHDVLIGDLSEEFERRQSTAWYWRQLIAAILVASVRSARTHPFAVARGLVVGWTVMWTLGIYVAPAIVGFDSWLFVRGFRWFYVHGYRIPEIRWLPWFLWTCATFVGGNLAVRASKATGMVVIYAFTILVGNLHWLSLTLPYALTRTQPIYARFWLSWYEQLLVALVILPTAALVGGLLGAREGTEPKCAI